MSRHAPTRPPRARLGWGLGRLLALVAFTVVMTGLGVYQVHRHYQLIRVGYDLDADLFENRRLREVHKRLELSLSAYKDPLAVRTLAEERLGMKAPGPLDELVIPRPEDGPPRPARFGALGIGLAGPSGGARDPARDPAPDPGGAP